jgi:hypothetical protein
LDVPPSVVTVTGTEVDAPVGAGTWSRQLVEVGQAMRAFSPPTWAVIWPDALRRLAPLTTRTWPAVPVEGASDESSGPAEEPVGLVGVGGLEAAGALAGGGTVVVGAVVVGTVVGGTVVGGAVAGVAPFAGWAVVGWDPAAGLLCGAGAECDEATGVPVCRVVTATATATTTAAATDATRAAVGHRRDRPEDDGRLESVAVWRDRSAASAMAARARALGSWPPSPPLLARMVHLR